MKYLCKKSYSLISRKLLLILLGMGCGLSHISVGFTEETPVTLKNISSADLEKFKVPKVLDAHLLEERVRQLKAGLEALIHMSEMIGEAHSRRAIKAQIDAIKSTIEATEKQIKFAPKVDYGFPAPLPVAPKSVSANSQVKASHPQAKTVRPSPPQKSKQNTESVRQEQVQAMSATQLSQFWGAIERASFRNEKMAVIRQVNRELYLTTQQAELLVEALTFSKDRRDAVKLLYPKLVDPSHIETLYRLLDQPAHRREVQKEVEQINMNRRLQRAQGGRRGY